MFDLPDEYLSDLINKAREITDEERMQYKAVYDAIETYIKKNGLIVNRELHQDRQYTIYTPYGVKSAIELANVIADINKYTRMLTSIPHKEFSIQVDGRFMVKIYALENYRGVSIGKLIEPVTTGGFRRIPPEIELIEYYHTLYSPEKADEWEQTVELVDSIVNSSDRVTGGRSDSKPPAYKDVLQKLFDMTTDLVLLGDHAISSKQEFSDSSAKIQCISTNVQKDSEEYAQALSRMGAKLEFREQELRLPTDSRIRRVSGYARVFRNGKTGEYPVIDIFNCGEYELIPYVVEDGRKIAHNYVLLRFLYIDIWILKIVSALKLINSQTAERLTNDMLRLADHVRQQETVPPINFVGTWYDPVIANKKLGKSSGFYPYVPFKHKEAKGEYKKL